MPELKRPTLIRPVHPTKRKKGKPKEEVPTKLEVPQLKRPRQRPVVTAKKVSPHAPRLKWEFTSIGGHQALAVAKGTFVPDPNKPGKGILHIGEAFVPCVAFQAVERLVKREPTILEGLFLAYPRQLPNCLGLQLVRFIPEELGEGDAGFVCRLKGETTRMGRYMNMMIRPKNCRPFALTVRCPKLAFKEAQPGELWDMRCRLATGGKLTAIQAVRLSG